MKRRKPRTGREADRAFGQPPFDLRNGGKHRKVYVNDKLVCCYGVHAGELSPGARAHIAKVLLRYGALGTLLLGVLAWLA